MSNGQLLLYGLINYGAGFFFALRKSRIALICMAAGLLLNGAGVVLRYWHALPMMPMYIGLPGLVCALAVIWLGRGFRYCSAPCRPEGLVLQGLILFLGIIACLFPKDFYLPFLRSATIWAHLFLVAGIIARALLIMASVKALRLPSRAQTKDGNTKFKPHGWAMWGFIVLTLSMFSGEVWSYLGWGTPVVWHDPAITTVMAVWFYWIGLLHLQYTNTWNGKQQAIYMVAGGLLVVAVTCLTETGPFRPRFWGTAWL